MLFWELIITACLIGSPSICEKTTYHYPQAKLSRDNCLRVAEGLGDKWVVDNPNYKLKRYKCTTTKAV